MMFTDLVLFFMAPSSFKNPAILKLNISQLLI
jgi:hypothetical protein